MQAYNDGNPVVVIAFDSWLDFSPSEARTEYVKALQSNWIRIAFALLGMCMLWLIKDVVHPWTARPLYLAPLIYAVFELVSFLTLKIRLLNSDREVAFDRAVESLGKLQLKLEVDQSTLLNTRVHDLQLRIEHFLDTWAFEVLQADHPSEETALVLAMNPEDVKPYYQRKFEELFHTANRLGFINHDKGYKPYYDRARKLLEV